MTDQYLISLVVEGSPTITLLAATAKIAETAGTWADAPFETGARMIFGAGR
jgi:hypothetical protein